MRTLKLIAATLLFSALLSCKEKEPDPLPNLGWGHSMQMPPAWTTPSKDLP